MKALPRQCDIEDMQVVYDCNLAMPHRHKFVLMWHQQGIFNLISFIQMCIKVQ
jgi:hypothetical protein